jgi:hypothetical protein
MISYRNQKKHDFHETQKGNAFYCMSLARAKFETIHRVLNHILTIFSIGLFLQAHSLMRLHSISKGIALSKRKRIELSFSAIIILINHSVKPAKWMKVPILL